MPQESQLEHLEIKDLRIPYRSFDSPTAIDPMWQDGRNAYANSRGYLERRPGFGTTVETSPTAFSSVQRIFLWQRWVGSTNAGFYMMVSDLSGGVAKVYKYKIGSDASASLIHTSASAEPFDFIEANNYCFFGNGTDMKKFDGATVTGWGITSPAAAPTLSFAAGTLDGAAGYYYVYTYGNSTTGHQSSSSPVSLSTGTFTNDSVGVAVTASTDPQVDEIHIYRTTDGGSANPLKMQEIANSPFTNTSTTHFDDTADTDLALVYAPGRYSNDPPTASMGFIGSQARIWSFKNNILYYSGYEEIATGVPEESWPSQTDGNSRPYKRAIHGLASMESGIDVATASSHYGIDGDSLDTFRFSTLVEKRGVRNRTWITSLGSTVVWLDTSNQIWNSDVGEVGLDIRPDLENINQSTGGIAIHISKQFHWICALDTDNSKLWVLNLDTNQWQVPWTVAGTAIHSGETSDGVVDLLVAINGTTICKLTANIFTDNGNAYSAWVRTNPFEIANKPGYTSVVDYIQLERNTVAFTDVKQMNDDNTTNSAAYVSIFANERTPDHQGQGQFLIVKRYNGFQAEDSNTTVALARRVSFQIDWGTNANKFELYSIDVAYHGVK